MEKCYAALSIGMDSSVAAVLMSDNRLSAYLLYCRSWSSLGKMGDEVEAVVLFDRL